MMTEHKDTAEVILSSEWPMFSEVFLCKVPELKSLSIELTGNNVVDEARLNMTLYDEDTGEIYYQEEKTVRAVMDSRVQSKAEFIFRNLFRIQREKTLSHLESEGCRNYVCSSESQSEADTCLLF